MAYGLVLTNTTSTWIYGTGLYSFFNVWDQQCLKGASPNCQLNMIQISNSKGIYAYALNTYGSEYILSSNEAYSLAANNSNTFCSTGIVDLNFF